MVCHCALACNLCLADVPSGDVLCHTGDMFLRSSKGRCCCRDFHSIVSYMRAQPHTSKLIIGGNHDRELEDMQPDDIQAALGAGTTYLLNSEATVNGLSFFGTPVSHSSGGLSGGSYRLCMTSPSIACTHQQYDSLASPS